MGLFDIFKSKPKGAAAAAAPADKNVARYARTASDRHAQNYDRMEALESLAKISSAESAAVLLKRFTFYIEPSITDQEEKEVAFQGIVGAGEAAIDPIVAFCADPKSESLTWPLKILKVLVPADRFVEEVVEILSSKDTDYARNVDPKLQLLSALEGVKDEDAIEEVMRFLEDVSEPVRFQAVLCLLATDDADAVIEPLVEQALDEESVRIRNKVAEGFAARKWVVPAEHRQKLAAQIDVGGFYIDDKGNVVGGG